MKRRRGRRFRRPLNFPFRDTALLCGLGHWYHGDEGAALEALGKCHPAFFGRKDRVILADADALARPPLGAALTHDDVAGDDGFAAELLHAKAAARGVAAIAG